MGDTAATSIEFLHAQLLSERSVSRTALERADRLAKRVVVLEEQLKSVTLQRKKAKEATTKVLAILVGNEIWDFPGEYDSSTDKENVLCESKESNTSVNEEESSITSKPTRSNLTNLAGPELQTCPSYVRSLSWKSSQDILDSHERRSPSSDLSKQRSFKSNDGSSTNQFLGKSCCKLKLMERFVAAVSTGEPDLLESQENRQLIGSRDTLKLHEAISDVTQDDLRNEERILYEDSGVLNSLAHQTTHVILHESEKHKNMEGTLDHQAQLIGQCVAENFVQREWDEKLRDKTNYTLDSCKLGNQSDQTDDKFSFPGQERKFLPSADTGSGCSQNKQFNGSVFNKSQSDPSGLSFLEKNKPLPKLRLKKMHASSESSLVQPFMTSENHVTGNVSELDDRFGVRESSGSQSAYNNLGGVLEALQLAKLSLKQELNRLPSPNDGGLGVRPLGFPILPAEVKDSFKVPVESDGLFRLPTNFRKETTYPNYGSSLTSYYPSYQVGIGASNDPFSYSNPDPQIDLAASPHRLVVDPYKDMMGVPVSSRPIYPPWSISKFNIENAYDL